MLKGSVLTLTEGNEEILDSVPLHWKNFSELVQLLSACNKLHTFCMKKDGEDME